MFLSFAPSFFLPWWLFRLCPAGRWFNLLSVFLEPYTPYRPGFVPGSAVASALCRTNVELTRLFWCCAVHYLYPAFSSESFKCDLSNIATALYDLLLYEKVSGFNRFHNTSIFSFFCTRFDGQGHLWKQEIDMSGFKEQYSHGPECSLDSSTAFSHVSQSLQSIFHTSGFKYLLHIFNNLPVLPWCSVLVDEFHIWPYRLARVRVPLRACIFPTASSCR